MTSQGMHTYGTDILEGNEPIFIKINKSKNGKRKPGRMTWRGHVLVKELSRPDFSIKTTDLPVLLIS